MEFEHGGNVWAVNGQKELAPRKVIDFSASLNPLGPPPGVFRLLREKIRYLQYYPEPYARTLCSAWAETLGVSADRVIAGNGASELISLFFRAAGPRRVLLPAPTYSDYARAALAAGSRVEFFFSPDKFAYPLESLARELTRSRCDALVFCNPNNPTGVFWEDVTLLLQETAAKGIPFLLDASFWPFTGTRWSAWRKKNFSFLQEETGHFQFFLVFSLTKIYALPGLRLGIGVGPPALIKKLKAANDPWSVNVFAQLAGLACLREQNYLKETVALVEKEREYLLRGLGKLPGLVLFPSRANFLLGDCRRTGRTGSEIAAALAKKGVLIRDARNFAGLDEYYFRLAVRKRSENRHLLRALKQVLSGHDYFEGEN
ncbi:MAG: threonine-phosphate decarboxylase [Bacillota bacterium]